MKKLIEMMQMTARKQLGDCEGRTSAWLGQQSIEGLSPRKHTASTRDK
jgi:hypothetical protein